MKGRRHLFITPNATRDGPFEDRLLPTKSRHRRVFDGKYDGKLTTVGPFFEYKRGSGTPYATGLDLPTHGSGPPYPTGSVLIGARPDDAGQKISEASRPELLLLFLVVPGPLAGEDRLMVRGPLGGVQL